VSEFEEGWVRAGSDGFMGRGMGILPYIATMDEVIPFDICVRPFC